MGISGFFQGIYLIQVQVQIGDIRRVLHTKTQFICLSISAIRKEIRKVWSVKFSLLSKLCYSLHFGHVGGELQAVVGKQHCLVFPKELVASQENEDDLCVRVAVEYS